MNHSQLDPCFIRVRSVGIRITIGSLTSMKNRKRLREAAERRKKRKAKRDHAPPSGSTGNGSTEQVQRLIAPVVEAPTTRAVAAGAELARAVDGLGRPSYVKASKSQLAAPALLPPQLPAPELLRVQLQDRP